MSSKYTKAPKVSPTLARIAADSWAIAGQHPLNDPEAVEQIRAHLLEILDTLENQPEAFLGAMVTAGFSTIDSDGDSGVQVIGMTVGGTPVLSAIEVTNRETIRAVSDEKELTLLQASDRMDKLVNTFRDKGFPIDALLNDEECPCEGCVAERRAAEGKQTRH